MGYQIKRAMVIGSGVMGGGIAGHLANAGIPVYLVDIVPRQLTPEEEAKGLTLKSPVVRNRIVNQGMDFLKKSKPPGLFSPTRLELITAGNMEDNWDWIKEVDWIIEVVVENLTDQAPGHGQDRRDPQTGQHRLHQHLRSAYRADCRRPFGRVQGPFSGDPLLQPGPLSEAAGNHPHAPDRSRIDRFMMKFGERRLGKTMVLCKDTPNFIANRVASITGTSALNYVLQNDYTVEEVDAITGPLIGHPKTASFRLQDLVGLDIGSHVANNLYPAIPDDPFREAIVGPVKELTGKMVEKGWLGNKAKQGFYKKIKTPEGKKDYLILDLKTLEYRPQQKPYLPLLKQAKAIESLPERLRFIVKQDDRMGKLVWNGTALALSYCAYLIPEISDTLYSIDDAVKTGFFHEMGPFEIWDTLGVKETAARMEADGFKVAPWVKEMIQAGGETFYKKEGIKKFYWDQNSQVLSAHAGGPQYSHPGRPERTKGGPEEKHQRLSDRSWGRRPLSGIPLQDECPGPGYLCHGPGRPGGTGKGLCRPGHRQRSPQFLRRGQCL